MDAMVLDASFRRIAILDKFKSFIWTDRYNKHGDFEIAASPNARILADISSGLYLTTDDSDHVMVIDKVHINTNMQAGDIVIISGGSLETILKRRIVWNPTILVGDFQDGVYQLLNENAINPEIVARKINLLEFEYSVDPAITSLDIDSQFHGEYLYEAIEELCIAKNVGFKIVLTDDGKFRFSLYAGQDRSYAQISNPYVVFSPEFDNMITADYTLDTTALKTVTLVAGEAGVGNGRRRLEVWGDSGAKTDLERREMFTDASGVTRNVDGTTLNDAEYDLQLEQKGLEDLSQNRSHQTFEGQVDPKTMYIYGEHFFLGDIVQVADAYGHESTSRVTEIIRCQDTSGIKVYPTFATIE